MANPASQKCPACGASSPGKFCHACGAPLGTALCIKCGASLPPHSKFCSECGAPAAASGLRPADRTAWIVAGLSLVALLVVVVVMVARTGAPTQADAGAALPAATDLTQLSPREQADRLFDRVMRESEAGQSDSVRLFAPMAIQATEMLGSALDADARLHHGQIYLAVGQTAAARAQADTILSSSPTHLYGLVLRIRVADADSDAAATRRALRAFAAAYASERAKNLPEYAQHDQLLVQTKDLADRTAGGAAAR
jgi:predicted nucleic acid-binding Zn ribbon protein